MTEQSHIEQGTYHGSLTSYVVGFFFSLVVTIVAYVAVVDHVLTNSWLTTGILVLAFLQLLVQLTFFLHLNHESRPRWNQFIFLTTLIGMGILVVGSIWIMNHLNYNMSAKQMNDYIMKDEGMMQ